MKAVLRVLQAARQFRQTFRRAIASNLSEQSSARGCTWTKHVRHHESHRSKEDLKVMRWKTSGILFLLVAAFAAFIIGAQANKSSSLNRSSSDSAYKLEDGPYAVEVVEELVLHDQKRSKDLSLKISYPKTGASFPVIIFSHGAGGSGTNYFPLTRFWATHGYVVIQPTHDDSIKLRRERGEATYGTLREILTDSKGWAERARDITLVIDSLGEIERRAPQLKGKWDAKRIGVGGHSLGAYTSQLIAGATIYPQGQAQQFRDERPLAFLLLSPQGKDQQGLTARSWEKMTRPMMTMTGSLDRGAQGQAPEWRKDPFTYSPAGDKYFVFIEGASHLSFTGRTASDGAGGGLLLQRARRGGAQAADEKVIFDYVKMASLAFWDAYLKSDAKAKAYLKSNALESYSSQQVKLARK